MGNKGFTMYCFYEKLTMNLIFNDKKIIADIIYNYVIKLKLISKMTVFHKPVEF